MRMKLKQKIEGTIGNERSVVTTVRRLPTDSSPSFDHVRMLFTEVNVAMPPAVWRRINDVVCWRDTAVIHSQVAVYSLQIVSVYTQEDRRCEIKLKYKPNGCFENGATQLDYWWGEDRQCRTLVPRKNWHSQFVPHAVGLQQLYAMWSVPPSSVGP
jgi:hypothetical protein